MRGCFLLTHVPNPRMNKRIEIFKGIMDTYVICTRRTSQNIWEPTQDVEHVIFDIDLPSAKHIVKRYVVSRDFQKKVMNKLEELEPDVIYAEGLDTLMIAKEYKKKHNVKIIFEVADLRENYISKPKKLIDRVITEALLRKERKVFDIVDLLVITSPKFYDAHYVDLISKDKVLFVPNVPDTAVFEKYHKKQDGPFTVGFIGGIRYLHQMKMLVDAAKMADCKVIFAGAGGTSNDYNEIQAYCKENDHVQFTGKYDYNSQIADLYGMADCIFAVYDADNPNVRIALPNKLYEAVYCDLPLIVAKGTYLSEVVNDWGVGVAVHHRILDDLVEILKRFKTDKDFYGQFVENCDQHKDDIDIKKYNELLKQRCESWLE